MASVTFGSKPKFFPHKIYEQTADDSDCSSGGSGLYYELPNFPMADSPKPKADLSYKWVKPTSVNKDNDYHSSILKKDGYL